MPSLDVIIGPNGLAVNAPVFGGEDRAGNPRLTDVLNKLLEGVRGGFRAVYVNDILKQTDINLKKGGPTFFKFAQM